MGHHHATRFSVIHHFTIYFGIFAQFWALPPFFSFSGVYTHYILHVLVNSIYFTQTILPTLLERKQVAC